MIDQHAKMSPVLFFDELKSEGIINAANSFINPNLVDNKTGTKNHRKVK